MRRRLNVKWQLLAYDSVILLLTYVLLLVADGRAMVTRDILIQGACAFVLLTLTRTLLGVYRQILRYGGNQCFLRLILASFLSFGIVTGVLRLLPGSYFPMAQLLLWGSADLLGVMAMRMVYQFAYNNAGQTTALRRFLKLLLRVFAGRDVESQNTDESSKVKVAIYGAGRIGAALADELLSNPATVYSPRCFVDNDPEKIGRSVHGLPVLLEDDSTPRRLREYGVQEIVFAIANLPRETQLALYERYSAEGYRLKVYDYPLMRSAGAKRHLREFDIDEVLFRKPSLVLDQKMEEDYRGKTVLLTGGGGSIGSELCRQLARMGIRTLIILDIYENGAYDVQQELRIAYGDQLEVQVEIASITNSAAMRRIFQTYHPQIVINAAAHKHVPLMEHNCIEAVENNVFGTQTLVELSAEFGAERFILVSTDKAVNPTNVMGATKRMCEMIVQSAKAEKTIFSATRFGNVLGSAGSVVPLFQRQIAAGGPITITDKRIIRYFMTIPEATQLVLQSGALAKSGEIFVLDMGEPVKILDLAQNMIRLAGARNIEIIETGLRPGEKLYEELLIKTDELDKTENSLIFIDRGEALPPEELADKLEVLRMACLTDDDEAVRAALKQVVPTYRSPEDVNAEAELAEEMRLAAMDEACSEKR